MHSEQDIAWMHEALNLALKAQEQGEVPVGAIIVKENQVIGHGFNRSIQNHDPSAHAEIQAIRQAGQSLNNYRLTETTLYVTLEPCVMCAGAIVQARIARVVFGAHDPKAGACGSVFNVVQNTALNHRCEVVAGVLATECGLILKSFFQSKRLIVSNA